MTTTDPRRLYTLVAVWVGGEQRHRVSDDEHAVLYAKTVTRLGIVPADATWWVEP